MFNKEELFKTCYNVVQNWIATFLAAKNSKAIQSLAGCRRFEDVSLIRPEKRGVVAS